MTVIKPQILAHKVDEILSILKSITENEDSSTLMNYPTLIGSRAAKWHIPSFREPNDWDLVATPSQSTLFINKIVPNAFFRDIKLIHYPSAGLKIVGNCTELNTADNTINFDIELVSNKFDLRKMKSNKAEATSNIIENNMVIDDEDTEAIAVPIGDKIEFEKIEDDQPKMSALMILELCRDVEDKTLFPLSSFPCIVAPLKVLEALKSSHIYWPTDFYKNIADLHSLRVLSGYNQEPMTQPLSIQRDEKIELMLKARIKETEIRKGIPGAHINLNKSNEEFLDREDNLFVQRRVPHDELHERVKYGDRPVYETLKDDKSKAWIKKSLFQKIDYQSQLNCVKEEAMVIALERYLIPMISKNQETSYHSALVRICTTLTKGWFRQFAIDNYPRLSNLNKDLLSIAHDIINNHPLQQKKLRMRTLDPETKVMFDSINLHTEEISSFDDFEEPRTKTEFTAERSGLKITSPVNNISIKAVVTSVCHHNFEICTPKSHWSASVVILPSEDLEDLSDKSVKSPRPTRNDRYYDYSEDYFDPLHLHPFGNDNVKLTSKHIFALETHASSGGSWGLDDIWKSMNVSANSADYIASKLEIPGFTGDLLFKYVLTYLQPDLLENGETPLKHQIDELKVRGVIPIKPQQHLWYDAWDYTLKNKGGKWKN